MAAVENFLFVFSTKTGAIIIGILNMVFSIITLIMYITFASLLGVIANDIGLGDHWLIVMTYVFCGVGVVVALLQIVFSSILISGVRKRNAKCVFVYLIYGTITVFAGLVVLTVALFSIFLLFGVFAIGGIQVYFALVVNKEYRNIQAEKTNGTVGQYPMTAQYPAVVYNHA